ncbi:hypothetical protein BBO99_00008447 [Phytophthora kernoviae]|uniref:Uncharacterized protein n=1 Tax=Phytophthora kernoviae TaxID=325452 RepID=A0A3R7IGU0_9STRA|nr:hypothetical protein BBI17_008403 [Phytophthora kernoviae]RLN75269.1 hypothetical protein BBO99_00008447 [Phytophthora kernoviae]
MGIIFNEANYKRSLRAIETTEDGDGDDDDEDDEERLLRLDKLSEKVQLAKMRRSAKKDIKAVNKIKAAQSAAAKKLAIQKETETRLINGWLVEKKTPDEVYKILDLEKLDNRAKESKNYPIYQRYGEACHLKMRSRMNGVAI